VALRFAKRPRALSLPVRANVVAWAGGYPARVTWYDAAGRVVKRLPG
jgi:hypothetical protein